MSDNIAKKPQSHRLTQEQLSNLQENQQQGTAPESKLSNDGKSYTVAPHETHLTHVKMWIPQFNPQTGEDQAIRHIQKFYPQEFAQMERDNNLAGYKVEILHNGSLGVKEDALKLNVTPKSGNVSEVISKPTKPLKDMTEDELKAEYQKYYNEPVPADLLTTADIKAAIEERINFIEKERAEAQANNPGSNVASTTPAIDSAKGNIPPATENLKGKAAENVKK